MLLVNGVINTITIVVFCLYIVKCSVRQCCGCYIKKMASVSFAIWIAVSLQVYGGATGQQCDDLMLGQNMMLSETTGWVGDPPIVITCDVGHVLDTGVTEKNITCDFISEGNAIWSDALGECEKKKCPNITTMLGSNMYLYNTSDIVYEYGDRVEVICDDGYAFNVDHELPMLDRVTSQKEIDCIDISKSLNANWEDMGNCNLISCSTPPTVSNSLKEYTDVTINSTVLYKCMSGTSFSGSTFMRIASCNESGEWVNIQGNSCTELTFSVGCLSNGSMILPIETVSMENGVHSCVDYCNGQNKGLAGVRNATCLCADTLHENYTLETIDKCDQICPGYDGEDNEQQVFCGGHAGHMAVYMTFHGCYTIDSLTTNESESVIGNEQVTCDERCRGKEFLYSAMQNPNICHCLNTTQTAAIKGSTTQCANTSNSNMVNVNSLAPSRPDATSCHDLYKKGIRMNGDYYLTTGKVNCVFSDGTLCEDGWIGFDDSCYYFNNTLLMNFTAGREFCMSVGADLVSITTEEEFNFLQETRDIHGDLWANGDIKTWWLGLIDNANNLLYSWVDGSLMTVLKFHVIPEDETVTCAVDNSRHGYQWSEYACDTENNVMCKKPAVGSRCIQVAQLHPNTTEILDSMSVSYCSQLCKGKQLKYAVFENTTCHCMDSLPLQSEVNVTECNLPCPGHNFQFCGGYFDGTFSAIDASLMVSAVSCEELHLYGIDNNTYHLQINSTIDTYRSCGESPCPPSWILLDGNCYKYNLLQRPVLEAFQLCAKEDSYMTTIETSDEVYTLMYAAQNISLYKDIATWRSGLVSLGRNGGLYRWSNGKSIELEYWDNAVTGQNAIVGVTSTDPSSWVDLSRNSDRTQFICERGPEYIGCYRDDVPWSNVIVNNYTAMTIQQCVELCRAASFRYAYLGSHKCACDNNTLTTKEYGACVSSCGGQSNQVCGGDNVTSMYDTDAYPLYESCEDLYDAGIFISATYNLSGTLQDCVFLDGTVCNQTGWLGIGGNCYKYFPVHGTKTRFDICKHNDAVQTSLMSVEEFENLLNYTRRVNLNGQKARIFTGISHGGYDMDVFISQDGYLTEYSLLNSTGGPLHVEDLYDTFGYIAFYVTYDEYDTDGGIICKEDKYRVGCYEKPTDLQTKHSFGSMELGMCRQLCILHEITLMGSNFCACSTEAELSTFAMTSRAECDERCSLHSDQLCGNGTIMWAYRTNMEEVDNFARSCEHLYKNGIFYNTTYMIQPKGYTAAVENQCGFTDNTSCEVKWLGKNESCFKIYKTHHDFNTARLYCALNDAYLFNPVDDWSMSFVQSFALTSGLLDNETTWMTGISSVFYNMSYVTSSGRIIDRGLTSVSNGSIPDTVTVLDISSMSWFNNSMSSKLPAVCQKDADYLGCNIINSFSDAAYYLSHIGNSLTQCMYWCQGLNFSYAAAHQHECLCFHDSPNMTSASGKCDIVCDAVQSQMCGGVDAASNKLYTVVNTTNLPAVLGSCQEMFTHGVYRAGWYKLRSYSDLDPDVTVNCFNNPPLLAYQNLTEATLSITASSTLPGQTLESIKFVYPFTSAWKPAVDNEDQFIKIVLEYEYIITGFMMSGLHTSEEQSYITSFRIQYRDVLTGDLDDYLEQSDKVLVTSCDVTDLLCFRFLTTPVVTNEIHLLPVTWYNSVSLQVMFAGQLFSEFNHSDTYIGCMIDPDTTYNNVSQANDTEECRTICRNERMPFASIDDYSTCWCGYGDFNYGFVNDSHCPVLDNNHVGTGHYRAIHRTFYDCQNSGIDKFDAVTTEEAEDMASCIGAIKYTETSAIEQSGFTSAFHSARDKEWIDSVCPCLSLQCTYGSKDKHCEPADDLLTNGHVTRVNPSINASDICPYMTKVHYECDQGYELPPDVTDTEIECLQSNTWSDFIHNCTKIQCANFTVENGDVTIHSLEYEGTARVDCHTGYYTDTAHSQTQIQCQHDKTWSHLPICTDAKRSRFFKLHHGMIRVSPGTDQSARSEIDCAAKCTFNGLCTGANYQHSSTTHDGGTCRLFEGPYSYGDLQSDSEGKYFEIT